VRELKNVLERAMIIQRNPCIFSENLTLEGMNPAAEQTNEAKGFTLTLTVGEGASMQSALEEARNTLVASALQRTKGNVSAAARLLGVSRDVLRHVVKTRNVDT
jgi:DNA-binding NtrC family response regulator